MSATADTNKVQAAKTGVKSIFEIAARADRPAIVVTRLGLIVVLLWIGGLKVFKYEAVSIVPLVANSPLMSFFYAVVKDSIMMSAALVVMADSAKAYLRRRGALV